MIEITKEEGLAVYLTWLRLEDKNTPSIELLHEIVKKVWNEYRLECKYIRKTFINSEKEIEDSI